MTRPTAVKAKAQSTGWSFLAELSKVVFYTAAVLLGWIALLVGCFSSGWRRGVGRHILTPGLQGFRKNISALVGTTAMLVRSATAAYYHLVRSSGPTMRVLLVGAGLMALCLLIWGFSAGYGVITRAGQGPSSTEVLAPAGGTLPDSPAGMAHLLRSSDDYTVGKLYGQRGTSIPTVGDRAHVAATFRTLHASGEGLDTPRGRLVDGYRDGLCTSQPQVCLPMTASSFDAMVAAVNSSGDVGAVNPWQTVSLIGQPAAPNLVDEYVHYRLGIPWIGDDAATLTAGEKANEAYDSGQTSTLPSDLVAVYFRARQ